MKKIHLIMPMGGRGSRFAKEGFVEPKPLIKLSDKPFLYWATKSILDIGCVYDLTFAVLKDHIDEFKLDKEIKLYFPKAKLVVLPKVLNGAVLTCLEAVKDIDDNLPIVFNDCDHTFSCKAFEEFLKTDEEIDGALLTFNSNQDKFSYVKYNEKGEIIGTVEKQVVSNDAICGAYYFKNKKIFVDNATSYLINCSYPEYFLSGVYNEMCKNNLKIKKFTLDKHVSFGVPSEYNEVEYEMTLRRKNG